MIFNPGMFTADSETIKAHILGLPITEEPIGTELPPGFEDALDLSELGWEATSDASGIIPKLQKLIKRWPTVPALKNYLEVAYRGQGKFKKATEVSNLILKEHPDYLFGKLSVVRNLLETSKISEAKLLLGDDLNVMTLIPGRTEVHLAEVKSYYSAVAKLYAMEGRWDKAVGILSALEQLLPDTDPAVEYVNQAIMKANLEGWSRKIQADEKRKIKVKEAAIIVPRSYPAMPTFHHPEIQAIYETDFTMTSEQIQSILDLPHQTRVADLCLSLRHSTAAAAFIWKHALWKNQESTTILPPLHVLHFLAASKATEALPDALRFLELHTDLLQMYFGDHIYPAVFANLVGDQSAVVFAWLRKPGIGSTARETMIQALANKAEESPVAYAEYIQSCEELLEFYLASSSSDNVIDTGSISLLVGSLINLRSVGSSELIQRLWHKNYILEAYAGDLNIMLSDLHSPDSHLRLPRKPFDIHTSYQTYENNAEEDGSMDFYEDEEDSPRPDYPGSSSGPSLPYQSLKSSEPGRNEPCSCGSGKKYKKCCLRS